MKKIRFISALLMLLVIFTGHSSLAQGFEGEVETLIEKEGEVSDSKTEDIDTDKFKKEAYSIGNEEGKKAAKKNNEDKKFISFDEAKYSNEKITADNIEILSGKSQAYISLFIESFNEGFKIGYEELINKDPNDIEKPQADSKGFGAAFGTMYGEMAGIKDYESGKVYDWKGAMPDGTRIVSMFDLKLLPSLERDLFIEQFEIYFEMGYEKAYYNAHFGRSKDSMDIGRADGIIFGSMVGKTYGGKDYHEGRQLDVRRNIPSDRNIEIEYSLSTDNKNYIKGFINGFKNSYQEQYMKGFRDAKNDSKILEDSDAYENGSAVGLVKGKSQASMDHMEKKTNDWKRSQPFSSSLISNYNLIYQTPKYRDGFINGFWKGYSNGYTDTYKILSQESALAKNITETIPLAGRETTSSDMAFSVGIEPGTYYRPVILNIDNLEDSHSLDKRYISASHFYRVSILNPSGTFSKDKKIKISFEYHGDKDGGIYILEGSKWNYLTSTLEDGKISAYVNPKFIKGEGNVFGVLVDTETEVFHDIRGHWAKDEITAYIRRGVINGYPNKTFKPDQHISRAEFLVLLSKLDDWYMPYETSNLAFFKDNKTFNEFSIKHISYAFSHNYIIGYPDKHFRPYNNISYKEVDIIMRKVLKDQDFKWKDYSEKMMYDKKIRSKSYDSYNNNITRAEFSYMLYELNQ